MFNRKTFFSVIAAAAVGLSALISSPASAQFLSATTGAPNATASDTGVTVYYESAGPGTAIGALVADTPNAQSVGWGDAESLIGASWVTPALDANNNPMRLDAFTGNWVYEQTLFVGDLDGGFGALKGELLTDDDVVSIFINGVDVTAYYTQGPDPTWQNVSTLDTTLVGGVNANAFNTLRIIINNEAAFVTGLAYNFSVVPVIPEPGVIVFGLTSGGALVGMMLRGRVRFNKVA